MKRKTKMINELRGDGVSNQICLTSKTFPIDWTDVGVVLRKESMILDRKLNKHQKFCPNGESGKRGGRYQTILFNL